MTIERATRKSVRSERTVTLPGKGVTRTAKEPVEIARELRAKSALGRREARLAAMEKKHGG